MLRNIKIFIFCLNFLNQSTVLCDIFKNIKGFKEVFIKKNINQNLLIKKLQQLKNNISKPKEDEEEKKAQQDFVVNENIKQEFEKFLNKIQDNIEVSENGEKSVLVIKTKTSLENQLKGFLKNYIPEINNITTKQIEDQSIEDQSSVTSTIDKIF